MEDEKLNSTIIKIENYFFSDDEQRRDPSRDCGEKIFMDFAKSNRDTFIKCKLNESTENKFEFTKLHKDFQVIYEKKLEEVINECGLSVDEFYEGLTRRCEEGDQESILFVDMLNQVLDFNSFMEMMANMVN